MGRKNTSETSEKLAAKYLEWAKARGTKHCMVPQDELNRSIALWQKKTGADPNVSLESLKKALSRLGCMSKRVQAGKTKRTFWCTRRCKHNLKDDDSSAAEDASQSCESDGSSDEDVTASGTEPLVSTDVATGSHAKKVVRAFVSWAELTHSLCEVPNERLNMWYTKWKSVGNVSKLSLTTRVLNETLRLMGATKSRRIGQDGCRVTVWCVSCTHASIWTSKVLTEEDSEGITATSVDDRTEVSMPQVVCRAGVDCAGVTRQKFERLRKALYRQKVRRNVYTIKRRCHGAYGAFAVGLMNTLRSSGLGVAKAADVASDVLSKLGKRVRRLSKNTIKRYDAHTSTILRNKILRTASANNKQCSLTQDTSSGCRSVSGTKFSTVSVGFEHPKQPNRCMQVIANVQPTCDGRASSKVPQIEAVRALVTEHGFDPPSSLLTDHEAAARHLADLCGLTWAGCISHKLKHTAEAATAVLIGDKLASYLETFHTSCTSATVSTTGSGPRIQARLKAESGGPPAAFRLVRQTGTRYCWQLLACSQVLCRRQMLLELVANGELVIPGSSALHRQKPTDTPGLLDKEQLPALCAAAVVYGFFVSSLHLLKGTNGVKCSGELSAAVSRELFPEVRKRLLQLKDVRKGANIPDWVSRKLHGVCEAEKLWTAKAGALLRKSTNHMMRTFNRFCNYDPDYEAGQNAHLLTTPSTNDFTEGFHGTTSWLADRLPHSAPHRLTALSQHTHNASVARELFGDTFPTDDELNELDKSPATLPSSREAHKALSADYKRASVRNQLAKKRRDALVTMAEDMNVPHEGIRVPELRERLVSAMEVDNGVQPPTKRQRR